MIIKRVHVAVSTRPHVLVYVQNTGVDGSTMKYYTPTKDTEVMSLGQKSVPQPRACSLV